MADTAHHPRHRTWMTDGYVKQREAIRYLVVSYCPGCLVGEVIDATYERPDSPNARETGLKSIKRRQAYPVACVTVREGVEV